MSKRFFAWYNPEGPYIDNERGLVWFCEEGVNGLTRATCLKLAFMLMLPRSPAAVLELRTCLTDRPAEELAVLLRDRLADLRGDNASYLFRALHRRAREEGLPVSKTCCGSMTKPSWAVIGPRIDWAWIAARLKLEWQRHQRRREARLQELGFGRPWESMETAADERVWRMTRSRRSDPNWPD